MILFRNRFIPFDGFAHLTWLFIIFERDKEGVWLSDRSRRHETIHAYQQCELCLLSLLLMCVFGFVYGFSWWVWLLWGFGSLFVGWLLYLVFWVFEILLPPYTYAYKDICFETEAYAFEDDVDYLRRRIPFWGWVRCIFDRDLIALGRGYRRRRD